MGFQVLCMQRSRSATEDAKQPSSLRKYCTAGAGGFLRALKALPMPLPLAPNLAVALSFLALISALVASLALAPYLEASS
eukprot:8506453-Alexandrium_andersonii.AAC.1